MVEIIPAILSKTAADYHKKLKTVEPLVDWVQIDIVDNKYARNQTIGPKEVGAIRTRLKLEIHLMVEHIENWLDPFINLKPARILFPIESARDPMGLIRHMKQHAVPFGFTLDPQTPAERLRHYIDKVDMVLVLGVNPGFSGQHFVHGTITKIKKLRQMRPDVFIEVDGGIEPGTARRCAQAGATHLAAGSFVFEPSGWNTTEISNNDNIEETTYSEKVQRAIEILREDVADVIPETSV